MSGNIEATLSGSRARQEGMAAAGAASLPALLLAQARTRPNATALRHKRLGIWRTWTWAQVRDEVFLLARALAASSFIPGSTLAVLGGDRPELHFAVLAAQALGGTVVPLRADADATEITRILDRAAIRFAAVDGQDRLERLLAAQPPEAFKRVVAVGVHLHSKPTDQVLDYTVFVSTIATADGPSDDAISLSAAGLYPSAPAFVYFEQHGEAQPLHRLDVDHLRLIAAATAGVERDQLTAEDEALATGSLWFLPSVSVGLVSWLVAGLRLNIPERADTLDADRREVGPTYYFAAAQDYLALHERTRQLFGAPSSWRRRLIETALAVAGRRKRRAGPLQTAAWLAILRPLRDVLGFSRVRLAATIDGELSPETEQFLRALRVRISDLARAHEVTHFQPNARAPAGLSVVSRDGQRARDTRIAAQPELPVEELLPAPAMNGAR